MPTILAIAVDSILPALKECATVVTASITEASDIVYSQNIDCVVTTIDLPGDTGLRFLESIRRYHADLPLVMVTSDHSALQSLAVDLGVYYFIDVPATSQQVQSVVLSAIGLRENVLEHRRLRQRLSYRGTAIVSSALHQTIKTLGAEPCVIVGEQGTEKDAVSYEIYKTIHCTGAYVRKHIRSEHDLADITFLYEAHHGCVVLDVLDDPAIRQRLILLLDNPVKVQIVLLAEPSFMLHTDSLAQLKTIYVLPLRDRIKELPGIIDEYIKRLNAGNNLSITGIDDEALLMLSRYPWPGNMVELGAAIYAMAMKRREGMLTIEDIPSKIKDSELSQTILVS